jgi:hypothetical protein
MCAGEPQLPVVVSGLLITLQDPSMLLLQEIPQRHLTAYSRSSMHR